MLAFTTPDKFRMKTPQKDVSTYLFNKQAINHYFCANCGIATHGGGVGPDGKRMVAVNLRCVPDLDLERAVTGPDCVLLNPRKDRFDDIDLPSWESADAVITARMPIDAKALPHLKRTRIVVRHGVGFDIVDLKACGEAGIVVLDRTPFYAESGGQAGDAGELDAGNGTFVVTDTQKIQPDVFGHHGKLSAGALAVGDKVAAKVDTVRRARTMRNHSATHLLHEALRAGAAGYVIKRAEEAEILQAIHAASRGDIYVHPAMTRALLHQPVTSEQRRGQSLDALTRRELDVLRLLVKGNTNRQIADLLRLSIRTVENHRANLMGKLGLVSRVELVNYAEEHHLL
jgi:DNA-binding NarL/FixJ family response regulator